MGAACVCHPLDVIRVQMQVGGGAYSSSLDAGVQIFQRSGLVQGLSRRSSTALRLVLHAVKECSSLGMFSVSRDIV